MQMKCVKYGRMAVMVMTLLAVFCLNGCGGKETVVSEAAQSVQRDEAEEEGMKTGSEAGTETGAWQEEETDDSVAETEEMVETEETEEPLPPLSLSSDEWGLGFGGEGTQPTGNAPASVLRAYDAYYVGKEEDKIIYLTFDCGYENGNTEPILDALKKHNVKATFFVVGHFLESAPELVKRMAAEGHAVGNHTCHHPDMATVTELSDFRKELEDVETLFQEITGKELDRYYRPPAGKCTETHLKMAGELNYVTIFWSLAYVDWEQDNQPGHEEAFRKLTGRIHPGAIVLLHNTSRTNGEILDELLTRWEEMGYEFRPLSDLVLSR